MRYKKIVCAILLFIVSCQPVKKSSAQYFQEDNVAERRVDRNKRRYIKLEKKYGDKYPELFNSDTIWQEIEIPRIDTFYLSDGIIDTTVIVKPYQKVVYIEGEGGTVEIIREIEKEIEKWRVKTTIDSFEVIVRDTISVSYPVIQTKYIEKMSLWQRLLNITWIVIVALVFTFLIKKIIDSRIKTKSK